MAEPVPQLSVDQKYDLITRNLQEVINSEEIKAILEKRDFVVYHGLATTRSPHLGYLFCALKLADLLDAGCHVKILLADLHAILDSNKSSFEDVEHRSKCYEITIRSLLSLLNANTAKLEFTKGTDFQLSKEYTLDMYKAHSMITLNEATKAGSEVVKQSKNPIMNSLLYPTLQCLDLHYLKADAHFSGVDQRKINAHALKILPKMGMNKGIYLMNTMLPALSQFSIKEKSEEKPNEIKSDVIDQSMPKPSDKPKEKPILKMSASDVTTKIDLLDNDKVMRKKLSKIYCKEMDCEDNTIMTMCKMVVFPVLSRLKLPMIIDRPEEYGGKVIYENYASFEEDFRTGKLSCPDFKLGVADTLVHLLQPVRDAFDTQENQELLAKAYHD